MDSHLGREEGRAIEVGIGIEFLELFDGPPGRSAICDMAADTLGHAGVEDGNHTTVASEYE